MPHLTSTRTITPRTELRPGFGIPGLAHPLVAPAEWGELTRPDTPLHWVVLHVTDDGPGSRPDPHCLEAAGRLRNAGVRVLGHLDTTYGARVFGEVISDAHRYIEWYQVDGFLLDHCPSDHTALPEIRRTVTTLRALRDNAHIVLGHGVHPYPGYAEIADQLVTFSGPWSEYRWSQAPEWTADHPPDRFCHLVHGVPGPHLEEALRIARWQGAATIYFTDRTNITNSMDRTNRANRSVRNAPWQTMPGYWDDIVSRIGTGVSE
ncbi:spherulation-specific family 4 protein [Streptomyces lincolnensis]|uniref:spherulation-specific family 4 protein n=1 Tax=Streptomyces lincolnensis TaxID=1915 RepID=UPI001E2CF267|nr:spherulation-specific family 4 protein [Streptomyces lincolnensis]MCD7439115.1 spherulation-specific family 4 protein [Streptomyces lincolnensis]